MSEPQPVLVIHGVGNRGQESAFTRQVEGLAKTVHRQVRLIPVFWGDLAADDRFISPTLPDIGTTEVRDELLVPADPALALSILQADAVEVRDETGWSVVADEATGSMEVRDQESDAEVREAIAAAWQELTWLPRIADEAILREAGRAVGVALSETEPGDSGPPSAPGNALFEVRGDATETRGRIAARVGSVLRRIDDLVGEVAGQLGGRLNRHIRTAIGPRFAGFFGDIFAYLFNAPGIQERVRQCIGRHAPGFGTRDRPLGAVAHSLGGVILFDMAVAEANPLHIGGLVTFGSQAPFFHAMSRRSPLLEPFEGEPVDLPATIGSWINLWEPLDVLAFVAARVFRLSDGRSPVDRAVPYDSASGLWTHSSYWRLPTLPEAMREVFTE